MADRKLVSRTTLSELVRAFCSATSAGVSSLTVSRAAGPRGAPGERLELLMRASFSVARLIDIVRYLLSTETSARVVDQALLVGGQLCGVESVVPPPVEIGRNVTSVCWLSQTVGRCW